MISQKHLFNLQPDIHYLNCASKAPLLKSAEEACIDALKRERTPQALSDEDFFKDEVVVKKTFAQLINCEAVQLAIVPSASYGFACILSNIQPKKNGKAIIIRDEFPSGHLALKKWCNDHHNEMLVIAPDEGIERLGEHWNQKILDAINEYTSVVVMSAVHWMNGVLFDLREIGKACEAAGAKFIVDGTQYVGALPIDVKECRIDALVCAGYKWLFGPYSLGITYFSDDFNEGVPLEEAWINRSNARNFERINIYEDTYVPGAGRYNVGETANFILMPMLAESLSQVLKWGVNEMQDYRKSLVSPLLAYLAKHGIAMEHERYFSPHLFALSLPEGTHPGLFRENLLREKVFISFRGQYIRVSVNIFNDEHDISALIEAIEKTRLQER